MGVNIVFDQLLCFALVWFTLSSTSYSLPDLPVAPAEGCSWCPCLLSSSQEPTTTPDRDSHRRGSNSHNGLRISGCCGLVRNLQHPISDESHCLQCLNKHLQMIENPHRCTQEYNNSSCSSNLSQVRMELRLCHLKRYITG